MKIDKLYRLCYVSYDENIEGNFFTTREEALKDLENMKGEVEELYVNEDGLPIDSFIYLQEIQINELDDIPFSNKDEIVSEWIPDLDIEEDEEIYYMWSK
jgi:hypothetical protein